MPMMICLLLAQTEPLSGGAGWIGAGLLGLVLGWLLFVHLPAKDKQLKEIMEGKDARLREIMEAKDKQLMDMIAGKDAHIEKMTAKFEACLDAVIAHCDEEIEAIRAYYRNVYNAPSELPKLPKKE